MKKFKNIWTIAKKEFYRFFKDKRILLSLFLLSLFLPGVLIFCIYSFLYCDVTQKCAELLHTGSFLLSILNYFRYFWIRAVSVASASAAEYE